MPDIFDEIAEELKKDNLAGLFAKYGKSIAIFCFVVLLAVAGYTAQQSYRKSLEEKATGEYINAANTLGATPGQALKTLSDLSESAPHPIKDLAGLRSAAILLEQGKRAEALTAYDRISSDSGTDAAFRNIATVILAKNILENPEEQKKYDIANRLQSITAANNAFRSFAYENLALLSMENHNDAEAKKNLLMIATDPSSAEWTRKRAEELLQLPSY